MSSTDRRDHGDPAAVREYVALDRALKRLEAIAPERSATLRLELNRARATYLNARSDEAAYAVAVSSLTTATQAALSEVATPTTHARAVDHAR